MTSLMASVHYGIDTGMGEMRKITVDVPADDLAAAQEFTGAGVTETVRAALRRLRSIRAQGELRKLRGTYKFTIDLNDLRDDAK